MYNDGTRSITKGFISGVWFAILGRFIKSTTKPLRIGFVIIHRALHLTWWFLRLKRVVSRIFTTWSLLWATNGGRESC